MSRPSQNIPDHVLQQGKKLAEKQLAEKQLADPAIVAQARATVIKYHLESHQTDNIHIADKINPTEKIFTVSDILLLADSPKTNGIVGISIWANPGKDYTKVDILDMHAPAAQFNRQAVSPAKR